ncbi:MAG: heavy-metal-associated domain-containing protein [Methylovulum sp.]|nr:heavy-metal-associated domain-containing protein [Methylovulum sp.]
MIESVVLTVTGMKCGGCETNVVGVLTAIEGISQVSASSKENTLNVEFDTEKTDLDVIKNAIAGAGFTVDE